MISGKSEPVSPGKFRQPGARKRHENGLPLMYQPRLFQRLGTRFPSTRYQGSKAKLVHWIWTQIQELDFTTALDAFGGTGIVGYRLKQEGKSVTYNDILRFNYQFGLALIENSSVLIRPEDSESVLQRHPQFNYPSFVQNTFHDIYFTDAENRWIDQTRHNIAAVTDPYRRALLFFALAQACLIKRPYNLFHRKNLYLRFAKVERSFGNKTSWDRPFEDWFRFFVDEANQAVFQGAGDCRAICGDVVDLEENYDLVYIDPPYISKKGVATDYADFYHFLEGLCDYDDWEGRIDWGSKHRRMMRCVNPWTDKARIRSAFDTCFERFAQSVLVVSYRSDGIPSVDELRRLMARYKSNMRVVVFGDYKYALSTNKRSQEVLLIGT